MCLMELHHNINLYNIKAIHNSSEHVYKHIYNSIKVNFLDFEHVNTIQDAKKETTKKTHLHIPVRMCTKSPKVRGHLLAI